ncbi:MAG TPA: hypothetical protein VHH73_00855 [Verrucomicrobiae bacterium]|nr:hypothetical protein [Verrucomicrobiae bacterium]
MKLANLVLRILFAAGMLCKADGAAASPRNFLSAEGEFTLRGAKATVTVSARKNADDFPTIEIKWPMTDGTGSTTHSAKRGDWFVFAEQPNRVWIFDGEVLILDENAEKSSSSKTMSTLSSSKAFQSYPKEVREALPDRVREKTAPKG